MFRISWILLAIAIIAAFYFGWIAISASSDRASDKSNLELTVDKGKVKKDTAEVTAKAQDLGRKIKEEAKKAAVKVGDLGKDQKPLISDKKTSDSEETVNADFLTKTDSNQLTLDKQSITLEPGAKAEIMVSRASGDQSALQLGLTPSPGSNLLASGGLFEANATSTRIFVESPKGARSGTIAIVAKEQRVTLAVSVKQ